MFAVSFAHQRRSSLYCDPNTKASRACPLSSGSQPIQGDIQECQFTKHTIAANSAITIRRKIPLCNLYRQSFVQYGEGEKFVPSTHDTHRLLHSSFGFYNYNVRSIDIEQTPISYTWKNMHPDTHKLTAIEYQDYLLSPHVFAKQIQLSISHDEETWVPILTWNHEYSDQFHILHLDKPITAPFVRITALQQSSPRYWALRNVRFFTDVANPVYLHIDADRDKVSIQYTPEGYTVISNQNPYPKTIWIKST